MEYTIDDGEFKLIVDNKVKSLPSKISISLTLDSTDMYINRFSNERIRIPENYIELGYYGEFDIQVSKINCANTSEYIYKKIMVLKDLIDTIIDINRINEDISWKIKHCFAYSSSGIYENAVEELSKLHKKFNYIVKLNNIHIENLGFKEHGYGDMNISFTDIEIR